jgi:thiamine biosynthesis lipoprotein
MKSKKYNLVLAVLAAIFIFYLLISRLENKRLVQIESPNKIVMNTIAKIIAVAPDEKTAQLSVNTAFEKIYQLEKLMNRYDSNSQLSQVNLLAAKEPVRVDKDLFDILQQSVRYSGLSNGAFDITVGPLVDLWKKCAEANSMPTDKQLAEVKKTVGFNKIILDANVQSVRFTVQGISLDLGAIAKGYAADKAANEMKRCGAVAGLVEIGGQIGCFGLTEKKGKATLPKRLRSSREGGWIVGIRNPVKLQDNQIIVKLALSDMAVSTSGDYERFYKIGGRQFSHIFNPATEKSANQLTSVTIIAANGTEADALATAVSVLGEQKGLELIEKTENTEAILIKAGSQELVKSSGAEQYLAK